MPCVSLSTGVVGEHARTSDDLHVSQTPSIHSLCARMIKTGMATHTNQQSLRFSPEVTCLCAFRKPIGVVGTVSAVPDHNTNARRRGIRPNAGARGPDEHPHCTSMHGNIPQQPSPRLNAIELRVPGSARRCQVRTRADVRDLGSPVAPSDVTCEPVTYDASI